MAFHYDKNKQAHGNDSFWTSYSDLFLGLSTIFLLLYVVSSLRTGTDAIKNQVDNQKLTMQVEELQNQLKMYESVKNDYMQKEAGKDEQQEYQELMDKLTLLQEDAKSEKDRLVQEALENEKKAKALNKYQQMVRNVMNANKVAKSRIITRNEIIDEQDTTISEQEQNIKGLEGDIAQKTQLIAEGNRKIANTEAALQKNLKDLQTAYKRNKLTKKAYEKQAKQMREDNERRVAALRQTNSQYNQQLKAANQQLNQLHSELAGTQQQLAGTQEELASTSEKLSGTRAELAQTSGQLAGTKAALAQTSNQLAGTQAALDQSRGEAARLQGALSNAAGEANALKGKIAALNAGYAAQRAKERAAFEGEMNRLKLGAAERAAREGKFRADAAAKERAMQGQLAGLQEQLRDTEGALSKAKEEIDARRAIAQEIKKGFAQAGIKADVDMGTGEVILDFGDAYFESDSANLKPKMREIIERAMPVYSKSLFGNQKVASKISNVEIIGFASPTYKGRFVDPRSQKPDDKAALKYNMDLSYRRANAIFQHIVDEKNPDFKHQQDLMALMKVSGRSFLEVMKVDSRNPASAAEFCKQNDCRKAQRVIVRFSMDGKK